MNVRCPYCNRMQHFDEEEWQDMAEYDTSSSDTGCHTGLCPDCGADCCWTCQEVSAAGNPSVVLNIPTSSRQFARMSSFELDDLPRLRPRQEQPPMPRNPRYPF